MQALVGGLPDLTPLARLKRVSVWELYRVRATLLKRVPKISEWVARGDSVLGRKAFEQFIGEVLGHCKDKNCDISQFASAKLFIAVTDIVGRQGKKAAHEIGLRRLAARERLQAFAALRRGKLRRASHMDAARLGAGAALAGAKTYQLALELG